MNDFQRMSTSPFDSSINGPAYMALMGLSTLFVDFLANLSLPKIVYVGSTYFSEKLPTFALCQKYMGTILDDISSYLQLSVHILYFAYVLQDCDNHLQVPNVQRRQNQPDVAKMAIARLQDFATSFAESRLHGNSHFGIEWAIVKWGMISGKVVEISITDFDNTLFQNVLSRPVSLSMIAGFKMVKLPTRYRI